MKINPSSVVSGRPGAARVGRRAEACTRRATDTEQPTTTHSAFTLIEIMIVVGIMAVIMAIGIPSVYQQMHKDSMRQVVADFSQACNDARARAILGGITTEVRIRPRDRTINAIEGSSGTASTGPSYGFHGEEIVERPASGGAIFSAKISDRIMIDYIEVNSETALQDLNEVTCLFYPNGTCDEMGIVLRSDKGEVRKLITEAVTGTLDWEIAK
jgi:prepilin-type N-terminal cleavage/methylation domain-containing protein